MPACSVAVTPPAVPTTTAPAADVDVVEGCWAVEVRAVAVDVAVGVDVLWLVVDAAVDDLPQPHTTSARITAALTKKADLDVFISPSLTPIVTRSSLQATARVPDVTRGLSISLLAVRPREDRPPKLWRN